MPAVACQKPQANFDRARRSVGTAQLIGPALKAPVVLKQLRPAKCYIVRFGLPVAEYRDAHDQILTRSPSARDVSRVLFELVTDFRARATGSSLELIGFQCVDRLFEVYGRTARTVCYHTGLVARFQFDAASSRRIRIRARQVMPRRAKFASPGA